MQLSIFFAEILHADRGAIDMKNIKWDLRLKAWVRSPWIDLGVGPRPFFFNMVMLHIMLERTTHAATW